MTRKSSLAALAVAALVATSVAAVGALAAMGSTPAATDATVALQDGNETNATMGNETNATMAANATANVTFVDQTSNGSAVYVNQTTLSEGGYVVIHLVENGTFGAVVGNTSYLEPGAHENLTVALDPPINATQPLIAMAHLDTNDNQVYEFPEADGPYVANGTPVVDQATVVVAAMGNVTDGNVTAGNVTDGNATMGNATGNSSVGA